ncbi:MAG: DUF2271 domain-containing protein [Pseudomonadota bacterium]
MSRRYIAVILYSVVFLAGSAYAEEHVQSRHYDGVLGTSMDLSIVGVPAQKAEAAFSAASSEVYRLERLLSGYDPNSELSRLNRERKLAAVSPDLQFLIEQCRAWEKRTTGIFSCKLGKLRNQWAAAQASQVVPQRKTLRAEARIVAMTELPSSDGGAYQIPGPIDLDLGGIAKGYVIDKALLAIQTIVPEARGIKVDIGGDGRYLGRPNEDRGWRIGFASQARDNAPDNVIEIENSAVAASNHTTRTYDIGRRSYGQILATRDGWPVASGASTYVVAPSALEADVVATTLASTTASNAIDWLEAQSGLETLLVLGGGRQLASPGWRELELATRQSPAMPVMNLTFEIPDLEAGKYRRPYVAVWITNESRAPIRNLLLLGERERWAQENPRWWRSVGRSDATLLDGYARATRRPGIYTVEWDGRDDTGRVASGKDFRLHIEAAREHGGHTYRTVDLDLTDLAATALSADGELGKLSIQWRLPSDKAGRNGLLSKR